MTPANVSELLRRTQLFADLDDDSMRQISEAAHPIWLSRREMLFAEGDEPDALYVVARGRMAIANRSIDGRESVVALMEQGDLFGELGLLDGRGRSADARALDPSTVVAIGYPILRNLYERQPEQLWNVGRLLARRLRTMDEALADAMFLDVPGRTAKHLLERAGDSDAFTLQITQEEIAGLIGSSRERVNKAISAFIRLGWLEQHGKDYVITNREQLTLRSR